MTRTLTLAVALIALPAIAQQPPTPPTPPDPHTRQSPSLQLQLDTARAQLAALQVNYGDANPKVAALRASIKQMETDLARERSSPYRVMQLRTPRAEPGNDLNILPPGTWWRYPETIRDLTLTPDQQHKMDDIFRQNRIQLIDLKASLEKEQLNLEPILNGNPPDTTKALAQVSRIADLRADLEKASARMLLGLRTQLTADQWTKLQTLHPGTTFSPSPFTVNMPKFNTSNENINTTTTTCTQKPSEPDARRQCTTTTIKTTETAGKRTITTCVQTPGQSTPKCTTTPAGPFYGSFNITLPHDAFPTPLPPSFTLTLPTGDSPD